MKISECNHHDPYWGYIELNDGCLFEMPKSCIEEIRSTDEELRAAKHALWMARAMRAKCVAYNDDALADYCGKHIKTYLLAEPFDTWSRKWELVERKCRKKAEEFKC